MSLRASCIVMLLAMATPAAAALNMREGLWETTLAADGRIQSRSVKCYTRDDIAEMERLLHGHSWRGDGACRYSGFTQSGDDVSYTMTCRLGDEEQTSTVSASYRGDSATGTVRAGGGAVVATSRRIGACSQSSFVR
jgi:hypothetical protein